MITQELIQFDETKKDLFYWIKNYIASKLYSSRASRDKIELFTKERKKDFI